MNKNYLKQKLNGFSGGIMLSMALAMAAVPPAYADDTDIYLNMSAAPQAASTDIPLVVLTLDLNLNIKDVVCSNVLADPATLPGGLVGNPACKLLQQAAVLPVLGDVLDLNVGGILDGLLGDQSLVGGLLGSLGLGLGLSDLSNALKPIVGSGSVVGNVVKTTQLDVVRLLLYRVIHQLVGVRLAIMVSHANTCTAADFKTPRSATTGCSNGAYFLLTPTELLEDNLNKTVDDVLARLDTLQVNIVDAGDQPDLTPPFQGKEIYYELYRMLTGKSVYNAPLNANDLLSVPDPTTAGGHYTSPLDDATCQGDIHVVNIMFTNSMDDDDSDAALIADLPGIATNNGGPLTFANVTQYFANTGFMYKGSRYRIKSNYLLNGPGAGGVGGLLSNLTNTLGTLPIGLNQLAIPLATKANFEPVNSTSASFGGPQPVFLRSDLSQASDALYYGMFKPNEDRKQAWRGNLKKLELTELNGVLTTVDAADRPVTGTNGKLSPAALTFWTIPADLPDAEPGEVVGRDGPFADRGGAGSLLLLPRTKATKENPANSKGSGSSQNETTGARVYYQAANAPGQTGGINIQPLQLDNTTVDDANKVIGNNDDDKKLDTAIIMAYARGYETRKGTDGLTEDQYGGFLAFLGNTVSGVGDLVGGIIGGLGDIVGGVLGGIFGGGKCGGLFQKPCPPPPPPPPPSQEPSAQPWIMGDVLHSTPLPIDYGNGDVRIFTGTNRGFLHQFRDAPLSGDISTFGGQEVWRFAPRAMLPKFSQWRTGAASGSIRPYGIDGAPVAWIKDTDGNIDVSQGDHVYLYFGLRRGGKAYYGLDVSDPDAQPTGLWSISSANSDFAEMGLTFSTPRVGKIRTQGANNTPGERTVLIFGGGYNSAKDAARGSDSKVGKNDTEGNAIYVVDATSGALIWKARGGSIQGSATVNGKPVWTAPAMTDGIASEVTTLDTTGDGFVDRLYVGDTGGRVWRVDMSDADPAQWKAAAIANLGRHGSNNVANDRRFFERPDVVHIAKHNQSFYALVIGSGNRADPLNRNTNNYLYVIKDSGAVDTSTTPTTQSDLTDFSENCASADNCLSLLDTTNVPSGWKIRLGPAADTNRAGEKAFSSPITIAGKVFFTSYVPPSVTANACRPQEGTGRIYAIDLLDASGVLALFAQDGEPGDSVSKDYARGTTMTAAGIPAGLTYIGPQTLLGSDFSVINIVHKTMFRTYWHERDGEH